MQQENNLIIYISKFFICRRFLFSSLKYLQSVRVDKFSIRIQVCNSLFAQRHAVTPIQWSYVCLNAFHHRGPVMRNLTKYLWIAVCQDWQESTSFLPFSGSSQPNFLASLTDWPRRAAWCISFLGMHPTLTQVPPRPHAVPIGVGTTKSHTATFLPREAASCF